MSGRDLLPRVLLAGLALFVVVYIADYAVLKVRASRGNGAGAFDSVTIVQGTQLKNGRVEVFTDQGQPTRCVNSIFPHLGYSPCWYLRRNQMQLIGASLLPIQTATN